MVRQCMGWRFGRVMGILASKFEHLANPAPEQPGATGKAR